jgi:hypothetical protein
MIGYTSKLKSKNSNELFKTVHAFVADKTLCDSELNETWWIHGYKDDADIHMEINCLICKKRLAEEEEDESSI